MSRQRRSVGSRREVTQPRSDNVAIVLETVGRLTAISAASAVRLRSPGASNAHLKVPRRKVGQRPAQVRCQCPHQPGHQAKNHVSDGDA